MQTELMAWIEAITLSVREDLPESPETMTNSNKPWQSIPDFLSSSLELYSRPRVWIAETSAGLSCIRGRFFPTVMQKGRKHNRSVLSPIHRRGYVFGVVL